MRCDTVFEQYCNDESSGFYSVLELVIAVHILGEVADETE